ncbi:hypothetical protein FQN57_002164 [Myotisia sp. PD_48]|nr:hypothetical protein FQN57_002164 [Myotisia sp. PD_48]
MALDSPISHKIQPARQPITDANESAASTGTIDSTTVNNEPSEHAVSSKCSMQPNELEDNPDLGVKEETQHPLSEKNVSSISALTNEMTAKPVSPLSPLSAAQRSTSPYRARLHMAPSSPNRPYSSYSPSQLHSPASSQIFERDVQEDLAPSQASSAIPSHIMTENHIPPILEASSAALTDERFDPDSVEIVTHNCHQPASLTVAGSVPMDQSMASSFYDDLNPQNPADGDDSNSNPGNIDSPDIRRLSFISFADLVHGEQAESLDFASNRDPQPTGGLAVLSGAPRLHNRSPSPIRSPGSSHGLASSPPTSVSPGSRGLEISPGRAQRQPYSPPLCPNSPSGGFGSELNVETMRQALRRTESGDLGAIRSAPLSAAASEIYERPFK